MLSKLKVGQPGVLGLVDNDTVARLVNIVVQPKVGRNPVMKERGSTMAISFSFQRFCIDTNAVPVHQHPVVGGHVRELMVSFLPILHLKIPFQHCHQV